MDSDLRWNLPKTIALYIAAALVEIVGCFPSSTPQPMAASPYRTLAVACRGKGAALPFAPRAA